MLSVRCRTMSRAYGSARAASRSRSMVAICAAFQAPVGGLISPAIRSWTEGSAPGVWATQVQDRSMVGNSVRAYRECATRRYYHIEEACRGDAWQRWQRSAHSENTVRARHG